MNLRIKTVEIVIEDTDVDQPIDNVVVLFENGMWYVKGPVFPRHTVLMTTISEFILNERRK